jgi:hypothetical protein
VLPLSTPLPSHVKQNPFLHLKLSCQHLYYPSLSCATPRAVVTALSGRAVTGAVHVCLLLLRERCHTQATLRPEGVLKH